MKVKRRSLFWMEWNICGVRGYKEGSWGFWRTPALSWINTGVFRLNLSAQIAEREEFLKNSLLSSRDWIWCRVRLNMIGQAMQLAIAFSYSCYGEELGMMELAMSRTANDHTHAKAGRAVREQHPTDLSPPVKLDVQHIWPNAIGSPSYYCWHSAWPLFRNK